MALPDTILSRFDQISETYSESPAVESDDRVLSYKALRAASDDLARELLDAGVGPGSFVPLLASRSAEYITGVLAVLRCGAAYAPIDPESPDQRRQAMLRPLKATCALARPGHRLPDSLRVIDLDRSVQRSRESGPPSEQPPPAKSGRDTPAYVMYTSGSTGAPKGVVVPNRAVVRLVVDADFADMLPGMRWAMLSAVAFDASTLEIWAPLLNGGTCVVQSEPYPALDDLARFFRERGIDSCWLTASLFNAMVDHDCTVFQDLDQLLTGGERESIEHVREFVRACPGVRLIHGYGPTENTTFSLCHTVTEADLAQDRIPIGSVIRGTTSRVDPIDSLETSVSGTGELLVGGDGLALGYLGDDDRTRSRFVTDESGDRWYRTGDIVSHRPDGPVLYQGRIDRQVKIRGHRIELEEVESAISSCPGVRQAAVMVCSSDSADRHLTGFFSPANAVTEDSVRAHLARSLPRTMIPPILIGLDELPRGSTDKLDREALALLAEHRSDDRDEVTSDHGSIANRLLDLVRQRLPAQSSISTDASFERLGGHSLLAMRLSADIYDSFNARVSPVEILTASDLGSIAALIEQRIGQAPPVDQPSGRSERRVGHIRGTLSVEQSRDPSGRSMLVHQAWVIRPGAEPDRVRTAWGAILDRHSALRTVVRVESNGLVAREADLGSERWFRCEGDLDVSADALSHRLPADVVDRIGSPLPSNEGPIRIHHWSLPDGSSFVVAAFAHAAIDEWSLQTLQDEFASLLDGRALEPCSQYERFLELEDHWLDRNEASRVAGLVLGSQADEGTPPEVGSRVLIGEELPAEIAATVMNRIEETAEHDKTSPAATAMALFSRVLVERFGRAGRFVLTPVSKRIVPELQSIVGCCLDMRLIDTSRSAGSVHEQIRAAQTESVLSIERVVELVRAESPAAAGDLTRFGFTYRHTNDADINSGSYTLSPIRVPQLAARFAIALHIERTGGAARIWFEASRDGVSESELTAIASAYCDNITNEARGGVPERVRRSVPAAVDEPVSHPEAQLSDRLIDVLQTLWHGEVGRIPNMEDNFLSHGGSSLKAMKLGAAIRDRTGLKLHVGEFLIDPTFKRLTETVREDQERPYARFRVPERAGGTVVLGFPGSSGRAVDLHPFWSSYSSLVEDAEEMIGFDLTTMAQQLGEHSATEEAIAAFVGPAVRVAREQAGDRPVELVGYSLGGLVALGVAAELSEQGIEVNRTILIDAYAPPFLYRSPQSMLAKINGRIRNRSAFRATIARFASPNNEHGDRSGSDSIDAAVSKQRAVWRHIHRSLGKWDVPKVSSPVGLVRSTSLAAQIRPLRHAGTNGMAPFCSRPIPTRSVNVDHLAMLTRGATTVARAAAELHDQMRQS